jgi:hypothetical protein
VSQETGRKTLYQLVRRWVEERGSAHHSRLVGKEGFGLIGGGAPPDAENLITVPTSSSPSRRPQPATPSRWRGHQLLSSLT